MMSDHERRLDRRAPATGKVEVEYILPGPKVRDLSVSGIYVYDTRPMQRGQTVDLRLRLADGESLIVKGMVRRVDAATGMAIEFIHIDQHDRRRIRDFVARFKAESRTASDEEV